MIRSLGSVQGPRLPWPPAWYLPQDMRRRVRSPAPSHTRAGRAARHQEKPGFWKSQKGIKTKWETHRGGIYLLGLWMLARSLPEKLGCQTTPGEGRRVGPCWTLTRRVSRLVRKLGCVKAIQLLRMAGTCFVTNSLTQWLAHTKGYLRCALALDSGSLLGS